jgi:hypothetical protein
MMTLTASCGSCDRTVDAHIVLEGSRVRLPSRHPGYIRPFGRLLCAVLALSVTTSRRAEGMSAKGPWMHVPPAAVWELVTHPALFRPFAVQVSDRVERALAVTPGPAGDTLARLLALQVHLALYLGDDARALAAAAQIREVVVPPAERPLSGLLTEALVEARSAGSGGPAGHPGPEALRAALNSRLASLPATAELTAALVRQRDRFRELTREALLAEAAQLAARLDAAAQWTLADVDHVVRVGHRLATILPMRHVLLAAFEEAVAARNNTALPSTSAGAHHRTTSTFG